MLEHHHLVPVVADRATIITSTEVRRLAAGEWADLWKEKKGLAQPKDLSLAWKPRLGIHTEPLHAWWHAMKTDCTLIEAPCDPSGRGIPMAMAPGYEPDWEEAGLIMPPLYAASSYDRFVLNTGERTALELKHTHARNSLVEAATYYGPQLQWQMLVGGFTRLRFSVICGNEEPEWGWVEASHEAQTRLIRLADAFRLTLEGDECPIDSEPNLGVTVAIKEQVINGLRAYDWSKNNEWVAKSVEYADLKPKADAFKTAEKELRALIPDDASVVTGGRVTMKRDARGAYRATITE